MRSWLMTASCRRQEESTRSRRDLAILRGAEYAEHDREEVTGMRAISKQRFDALSAYCRDPRADLLMHQLAWYEDADESVLGVLVVDTDGEFSGIVLARDLLERFRGAGSTGFFATPDGAVGALHAALAEVAADLESRRRQGDETGTAVDFFTPLADKGKLHPSFLRLASGDEFSAARGIIGAMMRWHEDIDGNFVEQFQTSGFDARIWELYLFAALTEANLKVERPDPAPDFLARGLAGEFALEATTINPTIGKDRQATATPRPQTDEEKQQYAQHYLPIRYAGPLRTKLGKRYWNRPEASGKPLVFAVQDFHDTMSMTYSGSALPTYLYGYTHTAQHTDEGDLTVVPRQVTEHRWGTKVIPSGFFSQPEAENISAVIFNATGTLSKFNRMGIRAGFGADNVILIRSGTAADPDPNASEPAAFIEVVAEGHFEAWIEGMDVYHNPNALHPLAKDLLPGAAHHELMADGQIRTTMTDWKPFDSTTTAVVLPARNTGD
jgi:hypothetical protein